MNLRATAFGLLLAAALIISGASDYQAWLAGRTLSTPLLQQLAHAHGTAPGLLHLAAHYRAAVFIFGCSGLSLFVASILWPAIEVTILYIITLPTKVKSADAGQDIGGGKIALHDIPTDDTNHIPPFPRSATVHFLKESDRFAERQ